MGSGKVTGKRKSTGLDEEDAIVLSSDDDDGYVVDEATINASANNNNTDADATIILPLTDICMLHPKNPIKIFATFQDEALRQNTDINNTHWSFYHCWTFREMLGFDRFSTLRNSSKIENSKNNENGTNIQPTEKNKNSNSSKTSNNKTGIDWLFISTFVLDLNFLLDVLPALSGIPTIVILYEYKDHDFGTEGNWIEQAKRNGQSLTIQKISPKNQPRTKINPTSSRMDYGCHHTKMVLIGYTSTRLRVIIHTSNLRKEDIHEKCQGAFIQDFLPKTDEELFSSSEFEETLITYMESYNLLEPKIVWNKLQNDIDGDDDGIDVNNIVERHTIVGHLQSYDFSTAVGILIPSVPGYHNINLIKNEKIYGYLKVQRAIEDLQAKERYDDYEQRFGWARTANGEIDMNKIFAHNTMMARGADHPHFDDLQRRVGASTCGVDGPRRACDYLPPPIVCQFSSIGSLSKTYLQKVAAAWNSDGMFEPTYYKTTPLSTFFEFVWPTVDNIVGSVEGRRGGESVPGRSKNLKKECVHPLLHKWSCSSNNNNPTNCPYMGKGENVPHIKSYYQICDETEKNNDSDGSMRWFVLSSHNLSKAAWGEVQNRPNIIEGRQMVIQSWEMGVLVSPRTLHVDVLKPLSSVKQQDESRGGQQQQQKQQQQRNCAIIPLPYKFRPDEYGNTDVPWTVD